MSEGLCGCGCGQKTELYRYSDKRTGVKKGQPRRFVIGHGGKIQGPEYEKRDLGYTTPCWIWLHGKNKGGYGRISGPKNAHVVFYERAYGSVPKGLGLDHLCHNADKGCAGGVCIHRLCVNPDHLDPTTQGENHRRGRRTKLTIEQVREIRATPRTYGSVTALAKRFNVHPGTINDILNHPDRCWPDA